MIPTVAIQRARAQVILAAETESIVMMIGARVYRRAFVSGNPRKNSKLPVPLPRECGQ
jgi:hypothetical protein